MKHKPKGSNQEKNFKETKGRYLVAVPLIPLKQKNKKEKKRNILTLVVRVFLLFFLFRWSRPRFWVPRIFGSHPPTLPVLSKKRKWN